ncbi:hypothetical protein L1987_00367 [Smallanthus sonchifolius]|uniref:Uncharacterized protein n=1 Tax=Smallanthus sonchifolius TaxID=185202 RepID=A0ACB9K1Y1_9ASTR|nr:hypothetical protein L1987_00367 [Smallanthus sonchifolius]
MEISRGTRETKVSAGLTFWPSRYAKNIPIESRGFIILSVLNLHSGGIDDYHYYLVKATQQLMCNRDQNAIRCTHKEERSCILVCIYITS